MFNWDLYVVFLELMGSKLLDLFSECLNETFWIHLFRYLDCACSCLFFVIGVFLVFGFFSGGLY